MLVVRAAAGAAGARGDERQLEFVVGGIFEG